MTDDTQQVVSSPLNPEGLAFRTYRFGEIEIIQLFEGAVVRDLDDGFIINASRDEVNASLTAYGLPADKISNSYTPCVARIGGQTVLFDTGLGEGARPRAGRLEASLQAAGIEPGALNAIVITHFHPDHIFGLMTKDGEQAFPDTPIHVPAPEYAFWTEPGQSVPRNRQALLDRVQATMPNWKNLVQFDPNTDVLPGIRAIATHGHSPGHTSLLLSSGDAQFFVSGDVTNIIPLNMWNPSWHMAPDDDAKMAEETRARVLDWLATDGIVGNGYHWGMPGIGRVVRERDGYSLEAVEG